MALQIYPVTLLDSSQVIQYVYDESTQSLRTTATATIIGGDLTVDIDGIYSFPGNPDPDNIGLIGHVRAVSPGDSNQTNRITSITNGIVHALDTSLHNSDGSDIDSSNPLTVDFLNASSPIVYNISAPTANTEYSQSLPIGTRKFTAKIRGAAKMQYSYVAGTTNTNFITVSMGGVVCLNDLKTLGTLVFYFQTNKASQTLEMEIWT